jgi:hypothetical protein
MHSVALIVGVAGAAMGGGQVTQVDDQKVLTAPSVGQANTVSAGEPVWTVERVPVRETVTRRIELSKKIKIGNLMKGLITIPQDSEMAEQQSPSGVVACTKLNMAFGRNKPCLFDKDGDGSFEAVSFKTDKDPEPLSEAVPYQRIAVSEHAFVGDRFKSVISYLGSNGTSLSLSYREFLNDMARPAFTEEMTVPLEKTYPQDVRVKGVTIRVSKISGLGLDYSIIAAPEKHNRS